MPRVAVVVGTYPEPEMTRRGDKIRAYAAGDLEIGLIPIAPSPYERSFGSDGAVDTVPFFVDGFRQAEAAGYHAVLPLGALDIAIDEGRAAVRIPVVGALECALHAAAFLGRRFGLIVYGDNLVAPLQRLVDSYGFTGRVAGFGHVGLRLTELAAHAAALEDRFVAAAQALQRTHGIDVVVAAGISLCPLHVPRDVLERRIGLRVIEAIGAPIHMAATLARLRA